jgi:subtilisin
MKKFFLLPTGGLVKIFKVVFFLTAAFSMFFAAVMPAIAEGDRLQGVSLTGDPKAMHRLLISFQTPPGEPERARVRELGGRVRHAYRLVPAICAHLPEGGVQAFARRPGVLRIEADGRVQAIDELSSAWGVAHIQSGEAHARGVTGAGVKVAVIDSGIDYNHPDISQNYIGGWDFVNDDSDPMDDYGHGTFVAGIVAAVYNGAGVVGVAPDVELYALKVLDNTGNGWWSDVIAALEWAVSHGIAVTNNSYGDDSVPFAVRDAFDSAEAAGVLNVAAAGNSGNADGGGDNVIYPARFASVIAVAATDESESRASFSSTGPAVELSAPGVSIYSTTLGGGYGSGSGTSFASPHVAGAAALVISVGVTDANGNGRSNDEVREILVQSADDLGAAGRDNLYGWGLVNAARAAVPCIGDSETDGDVDGSDLAAWIAAGPPVVGIDTTVFARNFGRNTCP